MGDIEFPPSMKERLSAEAGLTEVVQWFFELEKRLPLQWKNKRDSDVYPELPAAAAVHAADAAGGGGGGAKTADKQ
jgi:hypothetical protein